MHLNKFPSVLVPLMTARIQMENSRVRPRDAMRLGSGLTIRRSVTNRGMRAVSESGASTQAAGRIGRNDAAGVYGTTPPHRSSLPADVAPYQLRDTTKYSTFVASLKTIPKEDQRYRASKLSYEQQRCDYA